MGTPIDPLSYISGINPQAALTTEKKRLDKSKDKNKLKKFTNLVKKEVSEFETLEQPKLPDGLEKLASDKIIEKLQDRVHSFGDILKSKQTPETILEYKKAIKLFIGYVVKNNYSVTEKTSSERNLLKRKTLTQISIIDEKLDKLTASLLYNQKDQLDILRKIEEINGLLIDLIT